MRKTSAHDSITKWWWPSPWPPMQSTCIPRSFSCLSKYKPIKDASALSWRPKRRLPSFHRGVYVLKFFSSLACFCTFCRSIPTWNDCFSRNISSSFCFLGELFETNFQIQCASPQYQTNAFIPNVEKMSATHLWMQYQTADECAYDWRQDSLCYLPPLKSNTFNARWWIHSVLDANIFSVGRECILRWRRWL